MSMERVRWHTGAWLLVAMAVGFALARLTSRAPAETRVPATGQTHEATTKATANHVALTPAQVRAAGIEVVPVGRGGGGEIRLSGRVEPAIDARALVEAVIEGRVERVLVAPGAIVRAGEPLAILASAEAAALRAAADAASAQAQVARLALQRDASLLAQGVVARETWEASRARALAADAAERAARARSVAAGGPDARGRVMLASPLAGVVAAVQVRPGAFVSAGDAVATVSDAARGELVFLAPASVASRVRPGSRIDVLGEGGGFRATVLAAAADVGGQASMAKIRARAEAGALPPMGTALTGVVAGIDPSRAASVPVDAVQTVEGRSVVFVADAQGFAATPVLPGRRAGGQVEILSGLAGNERVAATHAFLLKAELAKGDAGHGH